MKKFKSIISIILATSMLLAMIPANAVSAAGIPEDEEISELYSPDDGMAALGETYEVDWVIPEQEEEPDSSLDDIDYGIVSPAFIDITPSAISIDNNWEYTVSGGNATITKYLGSTASVTIPATIDGNPVRMIGNEAFAGCTGLG